VISAVPSPIQIDAAALEQYLRVRLGGGSPGAVIWVKDGSETILHLDSLSTAVSNGIVRVDADFESDQLDRQRLGVVIALPDPTEPPGFFAATPRRASGPDALAARWGSVFAGAVWQVMLDFADELGGAGAAAGIAAGEGVVFAYAREPATEGTTRPAPSAP
jgi:hypothetical protein